MTAPLNAQQLAEIRAAITEVPLTPYPDLREGAELLLAEVDRLRGQVADMEIEREKLIRWHTEDAQQLTKWGHRVAELERSAALGPVAELRAAALEVLRRPNRLMPEVVLTTPVRWRVVIGDSESMDSIAPVCPAISDTSGLHVIADYPGGPIQDDTGVYDCCPTPWIEVGRGEIATYLVALLNADAGAAEGGEPNGDRR